MHVVMSLLSRITEVLPTPSPTPSGPDVTDFKAVVARVVIVILTAAVVSLGVLLAYHGMQQMTGGEEGAVKAKAGYRRVLFGFAGVVLSTALASVLYWVFGPIITKMMAGG